MNIQEVFALGSRCGWYENWEKVLRSCPYVFLLEKGNLWVQSASKLFNSHNVKQWEWRSEDAHEKQNQYLCLLALISSFWISREYKLAIAGWLLSKMLHKAP